MSEEKLFTLAEVAKHNSNKSARFVIHNKVYDVTAFLNEVSVVFLWSPRLRASRYHLDAVGLIIIMKSPPFRNGYLVNSFPSRSFSRSFYSKLLAYHRRIL